MSKRAPETRYRLGRLAATDFYGSWASLRAYHTHFSDILAEEVETEMKEAAEISMGTEARAAAPPLIRAHPPALPLSIRAVP